MRKRLKHKWMTAKEMVQKISNRDEKSVRMIHYTAFLLCSIPTMIIFGAISLFKTNYLLSALIFISATSLLVGLILLFRIKNSKLIYRFNMLFFFILTLYMVYMGGHGGSKSLWTFIFPLISFFLMGLKEGVLWCLGTFACLAVLFWFPLKFESLYPYPYAFKIRFLTSYTFIAFVTSWFEYFRSHYQTDLTLKNQALESEQRQLHHEIVERKRLEENLKFLANTDVLTGIMNRRYFWERTREEIERHSRYNHPMVLLMLDIDHFKRINDTHGHPAGDQVIKSLARILTEGVRKVDLVGRLGGEEFGILLLETSQKAALETADRLRRDIMEKSIEFEGTIIDFTASVGVARGLPEKDTVETFIARADKALYLAKENGRDRVELFTNE